MTDLGQKRSEVRQRLIDENEFPNIPKNWGVERLRFLFKESKERNGGSPVGEMLSVSEYRGVVPREYDNEEQKRTDDELENYRVVRPGQLAVNSMWLNHLGLGVSEHTGHVSPAYNVYEISCCLDRRFVHHLLRSNYYLKIYSRYLYGIRPNSFQIKSNDWASIPIIVPDLSTQREIADFLDRETARIDLLIEKKQKLVALLGEKRSTTITEAVTGAKNRGSAEGGSGVMWTRFETAPLRRHIDKTTNGSTATQVEADETTHRVTRIETISAGTINLEKTGNVSGSEDLQQFALRNGDILFSHINSMSVIGNSALVGSEVLPLYVGMNLLRIRPSSAVKPEFLAWCLKSDFIRHQVRQFAKPAINQASISTTNLKRVMAPLPDLSTQRKIADVLDRETARIDAVKEKTLSSIGRLKEYRSALITAAVTGQIDVTTYTKSGTTERSLDAIQEEMGA